RPALTSIATRSGAQAFKQQYASWGPSAGTSWDRGLFEAASSGWHFDVAVVITDSNADLYGDPEPARHPTRTTRFKEFEYGIASANALKARGTRVIGVAVGAGIDVGPLSGPTAYTGSNALEADRFELADFTAASTALHSLATELCRGSVSVVTQLVPAGTIGGEDVSSTSSVGAGWGVSVTASVSGLSGLPRTLTTSDDGTGTVNFPLDFASRLTSADVTFLPAIRAGYHLVGQGGRIAACVDLGTRRPLRVVNISALAFGVSARADFGLSCTIDVAQDPTAPGPTVPPVSIPLTVTGRATAVEDVDRDRKVSAGDALSYEYTVTNTSIVSVHNVVLISPALGAVICPVTTLRPGASTRCVSHAPYVITARDEATGWVALRTRAVALDPRGGETSSHAATVRTTIGESVSLVGTS
ncbi:MAG: hypothetical protein ACJ72O_16345, partial [Marmoricola sp.]